MIIITKDLFKPATVKISLRDLKKLGQSPGSWVEIYTEEGKVRRRNDLFFFFLVSKSHKLYYCSLWPAKIPDDHLFSDSFISIDLGVKQGIVKKKKNKR